MLYDFGTCNLNFCKATNVCVMMLLELTVILVVMPVFSFAVMKEFWLMAAVSLVGDDDTAQGSASGSFILYI